MKLSKTYVHIGIAALILILVKLVIRPEGSLTQAGVDALAVCIPTIYLWITVSTTWPSLLALMLICFTGAYDGIASVSAVSLGNQSVLFTLVCLIFSGMLIENGIIGRCADFFLSRRIARGRPYMFMFMFFLSVTVVVSFLEKNAVMIVTCELVRELMAKMGVKEHSEYSNAMYLGTLMVVSIGGNSTPVSHVIPIIMMRMIPADISLVKWCAAGMLVNAVMLAITMTVIAVVWKPAEKDGLKIGEYKSEMEPVSSREKLTVASVVIVILLWLIPEFITSGPLSGIISLFDKCGSIGPVVVGIVILSVVQIGGRPASDINAAIKKVPLRLIVFQCGVFLISDLTGSESTGIRGAVYDAIYPHIQNISPFMILVILVILAVIMTNFTSNVITAALFAELALALFADSGYPMFPVILIISYAVCLAMLTPSASVQTAIVYDQDNVRLGDVWKYAFYMVILMLAGILAASLPVMIIYG
jgi:sodium-dependent dicarboxylate transporter 2/3/5